MSKRKEEPLRLTVRLAPDLHMKLKLITAIERTNMTDVITQLIEKYVEKNEKKHF